MSKLTPKQEKFCQLYIELGDASEAYRQSYHCSKMKPETINRKATELKNNGTITARISVIALLVSLLASCQPSYANNVKVQQRVNEKNTKFSLRLNSKSEDSSQLEKINQLSFFDSFNCIYKVAVTGNNARQERKKLLKTVQHHTIVDVFLCLSFANCLFTGELRLALALVCLWWGGDGNKPFIRQIPSAVLLRFSNLPTALIFLGLITQTSLPFEKV